MLLNELINVNKSKVIHKEIENFLTVMDVYGGEYFNDSFRLSILKPEE